MQMSETGFGSKVQGSRFQVQGSRFQVSGLRLNRCWQLTDHGRQFVYGLPCPRPLAAND